MYRSSWVNDVLLLPVPLESIPICIITYLHYILMLCCKQIAGVDILIQIGSRNQLLDHSKNIGSVRLSEFWRNLDGLEECWRNLWEKTLFRMKKNKRIKIGLRARERGHSVRILGAIFKNLIII